MSIWNKVLIGLVIVATLGFFYLAMQTLQTHKYWRELAREFQQQVDLQDQLYEVASGHGGTLDIRGLRARARGGPDESSVIPPDAKVTTAGPGLVDLSGEIQGLKTVRMELLRLTNRGRVWYGCEPQQVDASSGSVTVKISLPSPHGLADNTVLYVFEEAPFAEDDLLTEDAPGLGGDPLGGEPADPAANVAGDAAAGPAQQPKQYLGEFRVAKWGENEVAQVGEDDVRLVPTSPWEADSRELTRLVASGGSGKWTLYATMPADGHEFLVDLDEAELRAMMPGLSDVALAEYIHDGEEATSEDIEQWGLEGEPVEGRYVRSLVDYRIFFNDHYRQRTRLRDRIEDVNKDAALVEAALAKAQDQEEFRDKLVVRAKAERDEARREWDDVKDLATSVQDSATEIKKQVSLLIELNIQTTEEIGRIQRLAKQQIDNRTRNVASREATAN